MTTLYDDPQITDEDSGHARSVVGSRHGTARRMGARGELIWQ